MAFILKRNESVGKGLVRVARKTLVRAIDGVTDARAADGVHAARKSTKKVRAILALVGRSVRHTHSLEKRLRRIGRSLSPLRDARAVAETLRRVAPRAPAGAWASVRVAADVLTRRADRHERAAAEHDVLGDTRHALKRASRELRRTRIDRVDRGDVKAGVKRAYRRARRSLAAAVDSGERRRASLAEARQDIVVSPSAARESLARGRRSRCAWTTGGVARRGPQRHRPRGSHAQHHPGARDHTAQGGPTYLPCISTERPPRSVRPRPAFFRRRAEGVRRAARHN